MCSESHLSKSRSIDKRSEKTRYCFSSQKAGDCSVFSASEFFTSHFLTLRNRPKRNNSGVVICVLSWPRPQSREGGCNISSSFPLHSVLREKHGRMAEGILVSTICPSCLTAPVLIGASHIRHLSIILKFFLAVLMGTPFDSYMLPLLLPENHFVIFLCLCSHLVVYVYTYVYFSFWFFKKWHMLIHDPVFLR